MAYLATVVPFGFPDLPTTVLLGLYRRLGCTASQFYRNPAAPPAPAEARRLAADHGLPIDSVHGLFGPDLDPSSPDEKVRRHAVDVYSAEADLAVELGGPRIVVHPAAIGRPEELTPQARAKRTDPLRRSMEDLARIGEKKGATFLFENLPPNYAAGNDPPQVAALVRGVASPNVHMCFDTGHAHMNCPAAPWLDACRDVVAYLHVHDNDAKADSHRIPGYGTLDWEAISRSIAQLPPRTPAMLELFESPSSLEKEIAGGLGERLRRWLAIV